MVQFLSINFFSWISSIFVGFFKSSRFFFVSLCILTTKREVEKLLLSFTGVLLQRVRTRNKATELHEAAVTSGTVKYKFSLHFCAL